MSKKRKHAQTTQPKQNTIAEYVKKMEYFEKMYSNLPTMEAELNELQDQYQLQKDRIRDQQRIAIKVRTLQNEIKELTRQRHVKEWYNAYIRDPNTEIECPNPDIIPLHLKYVQEDTKRATLCDAYHESSRIESEIKALEKRIASIQSRNEESAYILNTIDDVNRYTEIKEATRNGLGGVISNTLTYELPESKRVVYSGKSVTSLIGSRGEIEIRFVTKTGRALFDSTDKFHHTTTPAQLLILYCFKMRDICGVDFVAERIIQERSMLFLTEYQLLLPTTCKSIDQVIVHYGIDARNVLDVWVDTEQVTDIDSVFSKSTNMFTKRNDQIHKHVNKKPKSQMTCEECNVLFIHDPKSSDYVCPECGIICGGGGASIAEGLAGVPFSHQMTIMSSKSDYKPIMHLNDILKQSQAIESLIVPDEILDAVDNERIKHRVEVSDITSGDVRRWLKKLARSDRSKRGKYTRYYNNIPQIILRLGGPEPVRYSVEDERDIRKLFIKLIEPFRIFCPQKGTHKRQNLLGYNYLLRLIFMIKSDQAKTEEEQYFWLTEAEKRPVVQDPKLLSFYNAISKKMTLLAHLPHFVISY